MPTLELFTPPRSPDASHQVGAPGGYEWWYFDAEDAATDTRIVAIFLDGFVFHPAYLRRHSAYLRSPTHHAPAVPRDYPCAYFIVYRGGKILAQFMSRFPHGTFQASVDSPDLTVGPNRMKCDAAGDYQLHLEGSPWNLTWQGPKRPEGAELSADLKFSPTQPHLPHERRFLSRAMTGAEHHWILAAPLCNVSGKIQFKSGAGAKGETISFRGRGYHDHNFGTGPLGPGLSRWTWGRVLLKDRALIFHLAEPRDSMMAMETHLIEADADGVRERSDQSWVFRGSKRSSLGLRYPEQLAYSDALVLDSPRVIDASPFYLRVLYTARLADGQIAPAFCEVAYPHRLRWPVLGRMIEMSIHQCV